ncbi:hypothetical protein AOXY_G28916 [Acipenser oxyrinchus oxyrinchus]|uniref:Uncharacterized protein n=1 Tax=Acipenser oxyrinchus oxyrinchus TaxID=40147 RepID=A0AAD8CM69_ACIOX|nr:hypothetical protein AOXY_G28916 [Acipenser oxyrinchus oxyrinchus]
MRVSNGLLYCLVQLLWLVTVFGAHIEHIDLGAPGLQLSPGQRIKAMMIFRSMEMARTLTPMFWWKSC